MQEVKWPTILPCITPLTILVNTEQHRPIRVHCMEAGRLGAHAREPSYATVKIGGYLEEWRPKKTRFRLSKYVTC